MKRDSQRSSYLCVMVVFLLYKIPDSLQTLQGGKYYAVLLVFSIQIEESKKWGERGGNEKLDFFLLTM